MRSRSLQIILETENFARFSSEVKDGISDTTGTLLLKLYNINTDESLIEFLEKFSTLRSSLNLDGPSSTWLETDAEWTVKAFGLTQDEVDTFEDLCDTIASQENRNGAAKEYAKTLSAHTRTQDNDDAS